MTETIIVLHQWVMTVSIKIYWMISGAKIIFIPRTLIWICDIFCLLIKLVFYNQIHRNTNQSWWMYRILPVHTHGWYKGLSGVLSHRQTRHMSGRKNYQIINVILDLLSFIFAHIYLFICMNEFAYRIIILWRRNTNINQPEKNTVI